MPNGKLRKGGIKVIVGYLLTPVIQAAVLFGCAGRMDLPWLWVYLGVSFVGMFGGIVPVCIVNPELVNHRGDFKKKKDTKRWDKFLMPVFGIFAFYITWVVIGLDVGRYEWSDTGLITAVVGIIGFLAGSGLLTWSMLVNTHFETTVRIQTDRNHTVITAGPYRFVRHPGYVGAILWSITAPMITHSAEGLVPAVIAAAVLVVRTVLEDRTLQKELEGYVEYTEKTRYRLLPGVW